MAKLDKEDFDKLTTLVTEVLRVYAEEAATQHANNLVFRLLDANDKDLHRRVENQIRQVVQDEIEKHLDVRVGWR